MKSSGGKEAYSQESGGGSGVAFNFFAFLLLIFTALGTSCLFFSPPFLLSTLKMSSKRGRRP